jgi:hypothetical protein
MADAAVAELRSRYENGESVEDLAASVGTSWSNIYATLVADGVQMRTRSQLLRKHQIREDAFDVIDEDSAYWIGFLFADGSVLQNKLSHSYSIALTLAVIDEGHIRKFLGFLATDYPIRHSTNENHSRRATVSISSNRLAASVERFGLTPRKTHTAQVRELEMNRDFWRGVIDGDGCIHVDKLGNPRLSLVGSEKLVAQFRDFVRTHASKSAALPFHITRSNVFTFACHKLSAMKIIDVLYRDCKTALDRKKAIADALLSDPANFKDKREQESYKYKHLTLEVLEEEYRKMGSWKAVCAKHGVSVPNLANYRVKLRRAAKASEIQVDGPGSRDMPLTQGFLSFGD